MSMLSLFKKKKRSKQKLNSSLPLIPSSQLKLFDKKLNNSNITKMYYNENEEIVKTLDLDSSTNSIAYKNNNARPEVVIKRKMAMSAFKKLTVGEQKTKIEKEKAKEENKRLKLEQLKVTKKEAELQASLNKLKENISIAKIEKDEVINKITEVIKENDDNMIKLDAINLNNKSKDTFLTKFDMEAQIGKYALMHSLSKDFANVQEHKIKLNQQISVNKEYLNELSEAYKQKKKNYNDIKKDLLKEKKDLINHYHNILLEGIDTRKEGLSWVIRAIWDLGEDVNMNYIPNFLDPQAVDFLFNVARKYNTLDKIKKQIECVSKQILFMSHKLNMNQLSLKKNHSTLSTVSKSGDEFMKEMTKYYDEVNNKNFKSFKNRFKLHEKMDQKTMENAKIMDKLEKMAEKIEKEIDTMKQNEMVRITKEFVENDYEKRFQVSHDIIISALIGEDHKRNEFKRQQKVKKDHIKTIKQVSFYNTYYNLKGTMA